jgi:hypothetical protein
MNVFFSTPSASRVNFLVELIFTLICIRYYYKVSMVKHHSQAYQDDYISVIASSKMAVSFFKLKNGRNER